MKNKSPSNWKNETLENVATINMGQSPSSQFYNNSGSGLPFFQGKAEFGEIYPEAKKWCSRPTKVAQKDDVLISVRAPVGPTNLAPSECCIGRGLAAIQPKDNLPSKYLLYYLRSIENQLEALGTGTTFKAISGKILRSVQIPIAPPEQQTLIVAEIEKQFSRLDEAVANLKRIKANLKRYNAAVLKAAVEGKLTEDWRKAHPDVEPASKLLERILTERRAKWNGKGKYKEAVQPETSTVGQLPDLWIWTSVDQLSNFVTDGDHNPPKRVPEGVSHLTAKHIKGWRISFENCSYISLFDYERTRSRFEPKQGDLIVTCVGTVGQTAIVPAGITFSADRNLAGIRLVECGMTPKFLQIVLNSPEWQLRIMKASGSTAQPHLYLGDLRTFSIPLPPLNEQNLIVAEVERRLSVIDELEATVEANLTRADRLRQSILSQAFSGRLVVQDGKDSSGMEPQAHSLAAESQACYENDTRERR